MTESDCLIERSRIQYYLQYLINGKRNRTSIECISFFVIIFILPLVLLLSLITRLFILKEDQDLIIILNGASTDIVPKDLMKNAHKVISARKRVYLSSRDIYFWFKCIAKARLKPANCLRILLWLMKYSYIRKFYNPKIVANHIEYLACSSILTLYCEENNIQHVNFMHGEKPYFIRDAFFSFHQMYVFDEYYISLFDSLHANVQKYHIYLPESFQIQIKRDIYDFVYFLAAESEDQVLKIISCMSQLKSAKYKVAVKPHPRHGDHKFMMGYCAEMGIDYINPVTPSTEILSITKYPIALFSTCLTQAYFSKKAIVIDDVTDPEKYASILDMRLIFIPDSIRLSKFLNNE